MKKIVFATGNYNKLKEIRSAVGSFEIIGLLDIKITEELPETGNTLKENLTRNGQVKPPLNYHQERRFEPVLLTA